MLLQPECTSSCSGTKRPRLPALSKALCRQTEQEQYFLSPALIFLTFLPVIPRPPIDHLALTGHRSFMPSPLLSVLLHAEVETSLAGSPPLLPSVSFKNRPPRLTSLLFDWICCPLRLLLLIPCSLKFCHKPLFNATNEQRKKRQTLEQTCSLHVYLEPRDLRAAQEICL